eukprot:4608980-Prymnesium_polylepis.1
MHCARSGATPQPVSSTANSTALPSFRGRQLAWRSTLPASVYLMALVSRLSSTCLIACTGRAKRPGPPCCAGRAPASRAPQVAHEHGALRKQCGDVHWLVANRQFTCMHLGVVEHNLLVMTRPACCAWACTSTTSVATSCGSRAAPRPCSIHARVLARVRLSVRSGGCAARGRGMRRAVPALWHPPSISPRASPQPRRRCAWCA